MIARIQQGWWWFLDYRYALVWQTRAFLSRTDPRVYGEGALVPVVVIPGIYESWKFMRPLIDALHDRGHPVHVVSRLGRNRLRITKAAAVVAHHIRKQDLREVVIVAHSKGGLIGKLVMTTMDPENRITGMAAVSTPFLGSRYAKLMLLPSLRAFAASNRDLRALGADERLNHRVVSIFGKFDPHIPETSELTGARNVRVDIGGHFRIIGAPATASAVLQAVASLSSDPSWDAAAPSGAEAGTEGVHERQPLDRPDTTDKID